MIGGEITVGKFVAGLVAIVFVVVIIVFIIINVTSSADVTTTGSSEVTCGSDSVVCPPGKKLKSLSTVCKDDECTELECCKIDTRTKSPPPGPPPAPEYTCGDNFDDDCPEDKLSNSDDTECVEEECTEKECCRDKDDYRCEYNFDGKCPDNKTEKQDDTECADEECTEEECCKDKTDYTCGDNYGTCPPEYTQRSNDTVCAEEECKTEECCNVIKDDECGTIYDYINEEYLPLKKVDGEGVDSSRKGYVLGKAWKTCPGDDGYNSCKCNDCYIKEGEIDDLTRRFSLSTDYGDNVFCLPPGENIEAEYTRDKCIDAGIKINSTIVDVHHPGINTETKKQGINKSYVNNEVNNVAGLECCRKNQGVKLRRVRWGNWKPDFDRHNTPMFKPHGHHDYWRCTNDNDLYPDDPKP